jgi:hypothetical protein
MKMWTTFSETQEAWPFAKLDDALEETSIRFTPTEDFDESSQYVFQQNPIVDGDDFLPEIKIAVDFDALTEATGLQKNQIQISVVVRDRAIRRFIQVARFSGDEANGQIVAIDGAVLEQLSGRRDLEIVTIATPAKKLDDYQPGDRIGEKVFVCKVPGETKGGFPIAIIDPSEPHWDKSYSENTAWYISWQANSIFDSGKEAIDVLTIVYNKQCADKILHFESDGNKPSGLFTTETAVEVFHEIACVYLAPPSDSTDPPDFDAAGFYPRIVKAICTLMDVDADSAGYEELKRQFRTRVGFLSLLRSKLQEFYGLKQRISKVRVA